MMTRKLGSCVLFLLFILPYNGGTTSLSKHVNPKPIAIGVILHLNSSLGTMAMTCIQMALIHFYNNHNNSNASYSTTLSLHFRDSRNDIATAALEAWDLIKNEKVHAIIGPQSSGEAKFLAELGSKAHIPIISFSATSPSLSPIIQTPFFIRTTHSDLSQLKAITAIAQAYGWLQIIIMYENTEYGSSLIPYLTDAFAEVSIQVSYKSVIDPSSHEGEILKELSKLKGMQTKVFLVHMTANLGSKLFKLAFKQGMMREGYAWIVTQGLSTMMDPMDPKVMGYMQGVLGVRPMMPKTKEFRDFKRRWKALGKANNKTYKTALSFVGLRAYDTVQALAIDVEKVQTLSYTFGNKSHVEEGPALVNTLLNTKFKGLFGDFNLTNGQLEPPIFEVFNVVWKKERVIGYWSPEEGLFQDMDEEALNPIGKGKLRQPIWPGYTTEKPPKFRIGIPVRQSFTEVVRVEKQSPNGTAKFSGFAIDVFSEVVKVLPFPFSYELVPLTKENGTTAGNYDELLCQMEQEELDGVVGDITILGYRTKCVDFTLPYSESSMSMVVILEPSHDNSILLKPFDLFLWIFVTLFLCAIIVNLFQLESFENIKDRSIQNWLLRDFIEVRLSKIYLGEFSSRWSLWTSASAKCALFLLVQVYTAKLASMLIEETSLEPSLMDIQEIIRNNYSVGYQRDSWVKGFVIEQLGVKESQLKAYESPVEYHKALDIGSKKGGVAAIVDETPYLMLFLSKYGSKYGIAGPTYKTGGFSFAFQRNTALVSHLSVAILNVTQDVQTFQSIQKTNSLSSSRSISTSSARQRSLTIEDFGGFILIVFSAPPTIMLLGLTKTVARIRWFHRHDSSSDPSSAEVATLAPNEDNQILSPHNDDTFDHDHDVYHSDYY